MTYVEEGGSEGASEFASVAHCGGGSGTWLCESGARRECSSLR